MRNPDRVFIDVMTYSEGVLPPPDSFETREDLIKYLEEANPQMRGRSLSLMTDSAPAERRLLNQQQQTTLSELRKRKPRLKVTKAKAVNQEIKRSSRARLKDERITANVVKDTDGGFKKWSRNPSRFDFRGIDTKTHSIIKLHIKNQSDKFKRQGHRVINVRDVHVFIIKKDSKGRKFAQSIINDQRVPKRIFRRFVRK